MTHSMPRPLSTLRVSISMVAQTAAGDVNCPYRVWATSRFADGKLISSFDQTTYHADHATLRREHVADLCSKGCTIYEEEQNRFRIKGKTGAILSGKPDIIAVKGDTALIIDCKTGKVRRFHGYQVLLYMYVIRHLHKDHPAHACSKIYGLVHYQHDTIEIPAPATRLAPGMIRRHMANVLQQTPPTPTPSFNECRFCDLGPGICSERIGTEAPSILTDLF